MAAREEETQATRGPWRIAEDGRSIHGDEADGLPHYIAAVGLDAQFFSGPNQPKHRANAELIVRAVNNFDTLLAALKDLVKAEEDMSDSGLLILALDRARTAIETAEGRG